MQTKYVGGKPSWLEKQMNSIFGGDPNTAGYEPIYAEGTPDYEKQEYQHGGDPDMNTTSPIGYRRLMYGSPAPIALDQEEMAAQAGGPVADNMYGTDFSPPIPQARGIQLSDGYEAGPGNFNEVYPNTNIGMGAEYGTSGENVPTANVDNSLNQGIADNLSMGINSGDMSGGGAINPYLFSDDIGKGANPVINQAPDVPVFQEAPVIDYSPNPMNQAFAPNQNMSVLDRISQLLGIKETMPSGQDIGAAGIPNPPPQAVQQIGDGFGEAGTEIDMPAPPPPTSGSVRMPTQRMTQEDRPVPPGLMQTLLNRLSGKDPNKPFTGNPPPPSSGSVRMPTQNLGN